ncbi:MAG TPA: pilus assembly protein TadG-related protein, partial [Candidatus Acidoferrales bacterium]|nr:pilus assembly protein TadG-related protein [Candidatus Acidoferrales bacterium]
MATSISMVFMLGVAGLAVDIGRMYITKNEAQAYVDSASLNAAIQLDGTSAGITRATSALSRDTGKWTFDTTAFSSVTTSFGTSSAGPFTATPPNPPTNYNYVQVAASVNLPMYLIRPLSGPTATVGAAAVAGRRGVTTLP